MKKTFFEVNKPLVAMIQCRTADECIKKIKRSISAGADALGVQLCQLSQSERTEENLKALMGACEDKPVYVTSYRYNESTGLSDSECAELMLKFLSYGTALCDIPGDFFAKNDYQMTTDKNAVRLQKELIDKIHKMGGEVLISTHDMRSLSADDIFRIAKLQSEHGADVIKIVVKSEGIDALPDYINVIQKVNCEIKKPFLLLDSGACVDIIRRIGPDLGTCMYLCVESRNELDTPQQPILKSLKLIRDNMKG